ncbi:lipopolysaccharide biosynthesis protein [Sanyastnella coralliicola]|uniref:lipopolysaccharide biosynthesis protein n=1 Tax=Sanyastnella coralliicola TaxID=3069118 RepID=UPI0027B8AD56|nr:oligosaccharide flippase family protein [Longitalea sp. SCSIO 12813]
MSQLKTSEFVKNVLTLLTGTALGQVIALVLSVIVTRIYDPEMFASLEHFAMFIGILGVIAGGKYEAAIMLPKTEEEAKHLLALTIRIGLFSGIGLTAVFFFFRDGIGNLIGNDDIKPYLWLVGPTVFFFVVRTAMGYWFSRQKNYKPASAAKVFFSAVSEPLKIGTGAAGIRPGGLIYGVVGGHLVAATFLWWRFKQQVADGFKGVTKAQRFEQGKVFSDYPQYSILGSLLNRLAQWLHIALFGLLFGEAGLIAVGFMGLSRRIVLAPMNMLATSFSQVYFQRLTEIPDGSQLRSFYLTSLKRFSVFALFVIAVIWVLPDQTTTWIFGEEWDGVMRYLRILVFWFACNFAVASLGFILHRIRKQKQMLGLDAFHFFIVLSALLIAYYSGLDAFGALTYFVIAKVIYFIVNVIVTLQLLKKEA